jgi:acyl phosphate:glycerol-3-phosphate acyltransferase
LLCFFGRPGHTEVTAAILIGFAYLLGSVPTGFLLGYFAGVDVREAGSGNVGATNVARVAGKRLGLLTLVVDAAKGFFPVFLALRMDLGVTVAGVVALAAFFGHLYPIFLKFQGGKGVATALGVLLALAPAATGVLLLVFLIVALAGRIVSLASIVASAMIPVAIWLFAYPTTLIGLMAVMALMIVWRHRKNIQRLRSGVEPKFNF